MNFATIGTNFISKEFVKAGLECQGFTLKAVYSRKEETAAEFISTVMPSGKAEGIGIFTDLKKLAECQEIEAIYVASPNIFHFEQAKLMLEGGKHVFVEKPAVITVEQFRELKTIAEAKGLVLMEGMRTIFTPGFITVKNALAQLGKIRRASLTYCQYSRRYDNYKKGIIENAFDPRLGNGAIMDIGVYLTSSLCALLGMPDEANAAVMKLYNGLDYQGTVLCSFNEGILADLSYGKVSDSVRWSEIEGEAGTLIYYPPTNPKNVMLKLRGEEIKSLMSDESTEFYGMRHEINAFIAFARGDKYQLYTLADVQNITLQSIELTEKIRTANKIDFS